MHYVTAFDISDSGYRSAGFPAFGLLFVFLGLLAAVYHWRRSEHWNRHPRFYTAVALVVLAASLVGATVAFSAVYHYYLWLMAERLPGGYGQVEGRIAGLKPLPDSGGAETFCVGEHCFRYEGAARPAVYEGEAVRVTYIGGTLIKLEVAP
jgi:hypothetical protein